MQGEDFKRASYRVNVPAVADAKCGVDGEFVGAVRLMGGRRQHFAQPVGRGLDPGGVRQLWQTLAPPAGEVGHNHVLAEVQFGLDHKDPATWTTAFPLLERTRHFFAKCIRCNGVFWCWTRMGVQHAEQDLADHVRRQGLDVGIGGGTEFG